MKTKKEVVSEFRRAEIIDAARTVFAREGFARGIMDEIAIQAGMAKGTIYLYFKSKDEIYRAVLRHDMDSLNKVTLERIDAEKDLKKKIRAYIQVRIENADLRKEFFRIMDTESGSLTFTRRQYHEWVREPVMHLAAAIESAVKRKKIRNLPAEKIAWMITDITRGTIQRRLLGQDETPPVEEAAFLTDFIWAALINEARGN